MRMGHLHGKPAPGGSLFPLLSGLPPCGGAEPHTLGQLVPAGSIAGNRDWPLVSSSLAQGSQGAEGGTSGRRCSSRSGAQS